MVIDLLDHAQDVEIIVKPIPRFVSNWLIGIGRLLATLIKLKVTAPILTSLRGAKLCHSYTGEIGPGVSYCLLK